MHKEMTIMVVEESNSNVIRIMMIEGVNLICSAQMYCTNNIGTS